MTKGAYARISDDSEGKALGVGRQRKDCMKLAELRGWKVGQVYEDNDLSAYKRQVHRPEFGRMLSDLESGVIDGIVVYDLDRFARQPKDLERAIDIFDAHPTYTFATVQGDIDLSTPDGRTMARVLVAFANKASMDSARRVARKHVEMAQNGHPMGSRSRPFGFEADKLTQRPVEARLVREAAETIIHGGTLSGICKRWNADRIRTPEGNAWRHTVLKNVLVSPRLVGYRVFKREIVRDDAGAPIKLTGRDGVEAKPILELQTWEAVCAILEHPDRKDRRAYLGGRKYLLTGLARCGLCGKLLRGNARRKNGREYFDYRCECGQVGIAGGVLDDMVTRLIQERPVRSRTRKARPWAGQKALEQAQGRIAELMASYGSGELGSGVVFPAVQRLEREVGRLRAEKSAWLAEHTIRAQATDTNKTWPEMDLSERQAVLAQVLEAVIVKRAASRGRFDPGRVEPLWR